MVPFLIAVFFIGYFAITLEHPLKLDKAVSALLMASLIWAGIGIGFNNGFLSIVDSHGEVFHLEK